MRFTWALLVVACGGPNRPMPPAPPLPDPIATPAPVDAAPEALPDAHAHGPTLAQVVVVTGHTISFVAVTATELYVDHTAEVPSMVEDLARSGDDLVVRLGMAWGDDAAHRHEIGRITAAGYEELPPIAEADWLKPGKIRTKKDALGPLYRVFTTSIGEIWEERCENLSNTPEVPVECGDTRYGRVSPAPVIVQKVPPRDPGARPRPKLATWKAPANGPKLDVRGTGTIGTTKTYKIACTVDGKTTELGHDGNREAMGSAVEWIATDPPIWRGEELVNGLYPMMGFHALFAGCEHWNLFALSSDLLSGPDELTVVSGPDRLAVIQHGTLLGQLDLRVDRVMIR